METQGVEYHTDDGGADDAMQVSPQHEVIKKRALVEVFAVRIINERDRVGGVVLLKGSGRNYVLYEDPCDERGPQIDPDGYLTLIGPEHGVQVEDDVVLYPWFFDKLLPFCGMTKGCTVWKKKDDDACIPRMNRFIRSGVKTTAGPLVQVDSAVYSDAVEASLQIVLCDFNFEGLLLQPGEFVEVHGMVKASNSALIQSEAKSVLFNINRQNCIKLSQRPCEAQISVPLTRNVTVIPRESALIVDVCLSLSCASQDECIVVGSAMFDAASRVSVTSEEQIIHGQHAKAKVNVIWST